MKRGLCFNLVLFCVITGLVFISWGFKADSAYGAEKKYKIRLGHVSPAGQASGVQARRYKKLVEEKLPGKVEIRVYDKSTLGKGKEMLEGLQLNTIEMAILISEPPGLDPKLSIVELPWLYKDFQHQKRVMKGPVGKEMISIMEKKNLKVLTITFNGFRQVGNNVRPIMKPADFNGLKIRVAKNPIRQKLFKTLGANPTPVSAKEMYMAIKQGVLDGIESGIDTFVTFRIMEVCKHLAILNFNATPCCVMVSGDYWKSLPDDVKSALQESALEMTDWTYDTLGPQLHEKRIKQLGERMQLTFPDIAPFRKLAQPLYDDFVKKYGSEWLDLVERAK